MQDELHKKHSRKYLLKNMNHKESVLGSKNTLPEYYNNYQEYIKTNSDWRKQNMRDLHTRGGVCLKRIDGKRNSV